MAARNVTFANFICKFGEKDLLDYAIEIVLPAFLDGTLRRRYGHTFYFLNDCQILTFDALDEPVVAISGRFIKDTYLKRTQIYQDGVGLVHDEDAIESAPSVFFVLVLNNHKLIYLPEASYPPDISSFQATILRFLREKHDSFIDAQYEELRRSEQRITKTRLREVHPAPTLQIVPLATEASIEDFVGRYDTLEMIEFRLLTPNQEIPGHEIWRGLAGLKQSIDSESTTVAHRNRGGLDKQSAVSQIHDAAAAGNQRVTMRGHDPEGNVLQGNNESFKVRIPITDLPDESAERSRMLWERFGELVARGYLKIDEAAEDTTKKMKNLVETL